MYCHQCGQKLDDHHVFCYSCGSQVSNEGQISNFSRGEATLKKEKIVRHPLIFIASVLMFIWAGLSVLQEFLWLFGMWNYYYENVRSSDMAIVGWNIVVSVVYVVIGVGMFKLKRWGYSWGLGSNVANTILLFIFMENVSPIYVIYIPIQIAIIILLLISAKHYKEIENVADTETTEREHVTKTKKSVRKKSFKEWLSDDLDN